VAVRIRATTGAGGTGDAARSNAGTRSSYDPGRSAAHRRTGAAGGSRVGSGSRTDTPSRADSTCADPGAGTNASLSAGSCIDTSIRTDACPGADPDPDPGTNTGARGTCARCAHHQAFRAAILSGS